MKSFKQLTQEVFDPKFKRATKTDVHYTGQINGKTYVVPHSFHGNSDVLHGTKVTPIRYAHIVSPNHILFNNPTLKPEELARVHQHIKDIHPHTLDEESYFYHMGGSHQGQYVTAKSEADAHKKIERRHGSKAVSVKLPVPDASKEDQLKEDLKAEWNRDFSKNRRTNMKRTLAQQLRSTVKGKGNKAWKRADKEERASRPYTYEVKEEQCIEEGRPRPDKHWLNKLFPHGTKNPKGFKETTDSFGKVIKPVLPRIGGALTETSASKEVPEVKKAEKDWKKEHTIRKEDAMVNEEKDVFAHHQTQIAKKTLRMHDAAVGIMGGMNKEEARAHLRKQGWTDQKIKAHETAQFVEEVQKNEFTLMSEAVKSVLMEAKRVNCLDPEEKKKECTQHAFTYSGKMPNTGVQKCMYCNTIKEEVTLQEKKLTPSESEKKEEIVHGMKKGVEGFKSRYGSRAKQVMYATATARAKKLAESKDTDFENHPYHQKSDAELQSIVRDSATAVHALVGHKRSLKYADQHDAAASILEKRKKLTEGTHKFINAASSKKSIADAEKALQDNPGMWSGPKAGFKGLITAHKKHLAKLQESKYGYEAAMTSRLPAHMTHDPKEEKKLEQGHIQHCGKCGRMRVFEKGSMTCPVCNTEKVTEAVEELNELSRHTLSSYIKKSANDIDYNVRHVGTGDVKTAMVSKKRTQGIKKAADKLSDKVGGFTKLKESEQLDETFMGTYKRNESMNRHAANIVHLAKHFGTEADKSEAKFYADELKKHGHNKHHEASYRLHEKLWPLATAAHHYSEEVQQLNERKPYDAYDFAVGANLKHEHDADNRVSMNKEHGVYHIKGFKQGKHFWDTARTHGDAMKQFKAHKKSMSEEIEQIDEISLGLAHKVHDARIERGDEFQRQAVSGPHHNQAQKKMKKEYAKADKVGGFITRKHNRLDAVGPEGRRGTAYAPTYKFHEEAEQLDEMVIGAGSHKVIKAFLNKQPAESKKLSTDGKTLHGNWMGGTGIAHHEGGKVHLHDLGGKTALQVHRAIKKHLTYGSHSDVPHYDTVLHEHTDTYKTVRKVLAEKKG